MESIPIADFWSETEASTNANAKANTTEVKPWGWDHYLRKKLIKEGVKEEILPTIEQLNKVRELSSRKNYVPLLRRLRTNLPQTIGEAEYVETDIDANAKANANAKAVIKAPWSSSGRGVRLFDIQHNNEKTLNWVRKIIKTQGGVTIEPYYNKVKDLAMEFEYVAGEGAKYLGLSLFTNLDNATAYEGNVVASEEVKQEMLSRYIDKNLIDRVRERIIDEMNVILRLLYEEEGFRWNQPFGVDMMIVEEDGKRFLHPCVEVNLRRTMGYVAIMIYNKIKKENEKDFIGYFSVDALNGKCTICEQGMVSRQW